MGVTTRQRAAPRGHRATSWPWADHHSPRNSLCNSDSRTDTRTLAQRRRRRSTCTAPLAARHCSTPHTGRRPPPPRRPPARAAVQFKLAGGGAGGVGGRDGRRAEGTWPAEGRARWNVPPAAAAAVRVGAGPRRVHNTRLLPAGRSTLGDGGGGAEAEERPRESAEPARVVTSAPPVSPVGPSSDGRQSRLASQGRAVIIRGPARRSAARRGGCAEQSRAARRRREAQPRAERLHNG